MENFFYMVFAGLVTCTATFSLDTDDVINFNHINKESYFGFSLAMHSNGKDKWLLIGAPKAKSLYQPNLNYSGAFYKCLLSAYQRCEEVRVDDKPSKTATFPDHSSERYVEEKNNMWLGGSVSARGENVVVCSHLYKIRTLSIEQDYANGKCAILDENLKLVAELKQFTKAALKSTDGMANMGMSTHIGKDNNTILIGAPGMKEGLGGAVRVAVLTADIAPFSNHPQIGVEYMGYAVETGFLQTKLLVVGAPRARGSGQVYIFTESFTLSQTLVGKQTGSYFGATLCVSDVNGDSLDDLLVGAPLYKTKHYDEGKVHVYLGTKNGDFKESSHLKTDKIAARFGTAISSAGDLNMDFFYDVVVGAPFEDDGVGAVYVYLGSSKGIEVSPAQRITPSDLNGGLTGLRGFGFSLATGLDVDENKYQDVSVGAFKSGYAVVLKARPTVKLDATLSNKVPSGGQQVHYIRDSTGYFIRCTELSFRLMYHGISVPQYIDVIYTLKQVGHEKKSTSRAADTPCGTNGNEITQKIRIIKNRPYTTTITLEARVQKLTHPAVFELSFQPDIEGLPGLKPILDPKYSTKLQTQIIFARTCESQLNMTSPVPYIILGDTSLVSVDIHIDNSALHKCFLQFNISHQGEVTYTKVTVQGRSGVVCNPVNIQGRESVVCETTPMVEADSNDVITMTFDPKDANLMNYLTLELMTDYHVPLQLQIPVRKRSDLQMTGFSHPESMKFGSEEKSRTFYHTYSAYNAGPSPASLQRIIASIPSTTLHSQPIIYNKTSLKVKINENQIVHCETLDEESDGLKANPSFLGTSEDSAHRLSCKTANCIVLQCGTYSMPAKEHLKIEISFLLNMTTIKAQSKATVFLQTSALIQLSDNLGKNRQIRTQVETMMMREDSLPLFILLIGIGAGLLIMITIIIIMKRCGFFRRPEKEEMKQFLVETSNKDKTEEIQNESTIENKI